LLGSKHSFYGRSAPDMIMRADDDLCQHIT